MTQRQRWVLVGTLVAGLLLSLAVTRLVPVAPVGQVQVAKWDARLSQLNAAVTPAACYNLPYFKIVEAWITVNGNWSDPAIPAFAKARQRDYLGGDHHAWGLTLDAAGNPYVQPGYALRWPDGEHGVLGEPGNGQWANAELYAGFDPLTGGGPYSWVKGPSGVAPCGAETLTGLGMPYTLPWVSGDVQVAGGHHCSYFAVWQLVEPQPTPTPVPTVGPTPAPLGGAYWLTLGPFRVAVELEDR